MRDQEQLTLFRELSSKYRSTLDRLSAGDDAAWASPPADDRYRWDTWGEDFVRLCTPVVPLDFLRRPPLTGTMVFRGAKHLVRQRCDDVVRSFPDHAKALLEEDAAGRPRLVKFGQVRTSANRAHHAHHLAEYERLMGRSPFETRTVVEWGGGYGDMARIFTKVAPETTYVILDIPPVGALQYVYLASVMGDEAVNVVDLEKNSIVQGKVNVASSAKVVSGVLDVGAGLFISNQAATESPADAQDYLRQTRFLGADRILVSYHIDEGNHLRDALSLLGCVLSPLSLLREEGHVGNEYAFL